VAGTNEADWLSYDAALAEILAACRPLGVETAGLSEALDRAVAESVRSRVTQPPWDNSAMDGYAVRAEDVTGAAPDRPVTLPVSDDVRAGSFPAGPLAAGTAARVMTGAPVPVGATGVIRVEHTDGGTKRVTIQRDDDAERHIRLAGEDLRPGDVVLEAGDTLTPAAIGTLALTGIDAVPVRRAPRVGVLANGDELADLDDFDEVLAGRKIVSSNSYSVAAQLRTAGAEPIPLGIARDDPNDLRERLSRVEECDALISTAGVSVGEYDHVRKVLGDMGLQRSFWRVKARPGSALLFGTLDGKPVWGVPGNPVSAMVCFEAFVRPALRKMAGHTRLRRRMLRAVAGEAMSTPAELTYFLRVTLEEADDALDGVPAARLTGAQGSGILSSMLRADGLLIVPETTQRYAKGDPVSVIPLCAWRRRATR
jgi:molybdopterin molybdotransferase